MDRQQALCRSIRGKLHPKTDKFSSFNVNSGYGATMDASKITDKQLSCFKDPINYYGNIMDNFIFPSPLVNHSQQLLSEQKAAPTLHLIVCALVFQVMVIQIRQTRKSFPCLKVGNFRSKLQTTEKSVKQLK